MLTGHKRTVLARHHVDGWTPAERWSYIAYIALIAQQWASGALTWRSRYAECTPDGYADVYVIECSEVGA